MIAGGEDADEYRPLAAGMRPAKELGILKWLIADLGVLRRLLGTALRHGSADFFVTQTMTASVSGNGMTVLLPVGAP